MFFYGRDDLSGLAVCCFASSNVILGVTAFIICAKLVKYDHIGLAHVIWTGAYTDTFAIASFGYDRAFYAGVCDVPLLKLKDNCNRILCALFIHWTILGYNITRVSVFGTDNFLSYRKRLK